MPSFLRFQPKNHPLNSTKPTIDFSGWPIYANASLPDQTAYDICDALAAREAEIPWESGTDGTALHMGRESDSTPMDVPLQPGAERWYREHGVSAR